jgi:DNA-binding NarL/FixJ family response regulator
MNRFDEKTVLVGNGEHIDAHVHVYPKTRLTPFEEHLLQLLAAGMRRGEIARKLHRAPQTISNSLTTAKNKIGARTLAEAVARISDLDKNSA